MKKYQLTDETLVVDGRTLHRIRALKSFGDVIAGELGGWIESEKNLSHGGNAWVYGNAQVCGDAQVYGDAQVFGNARVCGNARVFGDARVFGNAQVCGLDQILWIAPIGSRNDTTTFFACADGKIRAKCGCFYGDLDEFENAIQRTHGDNQYAVVYRLAIEMARARILIPNAKQGGERNG